MLIKNFNVNKQFFNDLAKRTTACALITTMLLCTTACGKKEKDNSNEIGFNVTSSTWSNDIGLYNYVINSKGLHSEKYDFEDTIRHINFAKVSELEEYNSKNIIKRKTDGFYRAAVKMIWPDCYSKLYTSPAWLASHNFHYEIKYEKLDELSGNSYVVVYSSMTARRDLDTGLYMISDGQKEIKKGDNMSSIAIYYEGELVAYKQTGVGSECNNVLEGTIGDVDLALKKVSQFENLTESKEMTDKELYDYQDQINGKQIEKKLIK